MYLSSKSNRYGYWIQRKKNVNWNRMSNPLNSRLDLLLVDFETNVLPLHNWYIDSVSLWRSFSQGVGGWVDDDFLHHLLSDSSWLGHNHQPTPSIYFGQLMLSINNPIIWSLIVESVTARIINTVFWLASQCPISS